MKNACFYWTSCLNWWLYCKPKNCYCLPWLKIRTAKFVKTKNCLTKSDRTGNQFLQNCQTNEYKLKVHSLKISYVIFHFLYIQSRLNLPHIGSFPKTLCFGFENSEGKGEEYLHKFGCWEDLISRTQTFIPTFDRKWLVLWTLHCTADKSVVRWYFFILDSQNPA